MVNIILANQNPDSHIAQVIIHIEKKQVTLPDKQKIDLGQLQKKFQFKHPLFDEKIKLNPDYFFHYEYDSLDDMFYSAIYVYAILLKVDKPKKCRFKINPSSKFKKSALPKKLHFSIHPQKPAQKSITIAQLESLVEGFTIHPFNFSNDVLIDGEFSLRDLPSSIDATLLYQTNHSLLTQLKSPPQFEPYELRYISIDVGFGVFSRETIPQDTIIATYAGVKTHEVLHSQQYKFKSKPDALSMYLDASRFGNLTRFINHAPTSNSAKATTKSKNNELLTANVEAKACEINGISLVNFITKREILKHEPLLLDYGAGFFPTDNPNIVRFKADGKIVDSYSHLKKYYHRKKVGINPLKIMASRGIEEAQNYLLIRGLAILLVTAFIVGLFNALST